MLSTAFSLVLGAAAVYFFYERNYLAGVILLSLALIGIYQHRLKHFAKGLDTILKYSDLERNANCFLRLGVDIDALLEHDAVSALFRKLQCTGRIRNDITKEDWTAQLLENYREKYKTESAHPEVKFNIKHNLLWKDGEIDFADHIYHELFIPYDASTGSRKMTTQPGTPRDDRDRWLEIWYHPEEIHAGLTIRVFVVNGIIKLQIGKFSKRLNPEEIQGLFTVYRTWETITSFPLLYFSYQHKIPQRYLNLSAYATDSWQRRHEKKDIKIKWKSARVGDWKQLMTDIKIKWKSERFGDWKQVLKDVAAYNYVCSVADHVEDWRRWDKIINTFKSKRKTWLEREGFSNPLGWDEKDEVYIRLSQNSLDYANSYLCVYAANYDYGHEDLGRYLYSDYYERQPRP